MLGSVRLSHLLCDPVFVTAGGSTEIAALEALLSNVQWAYLYQRANVSIVSHLPSSMMLQSLRIVIFTILSWHLVECATTVAFYSDGQCSNLLASINGAENGVCQQAGVSGINSVQLISVDSPFLGKTSTSGTHDARFLSPQVLIYSDTTCSDSAKGIHSFMGCVPGNWNSLSIDIPLGVSPPSTTVAYAPTNTSGGSGSDQGSSTNLSPASQIALATVLPGVSVVVALVGLWLYVKKESRRKSITLREKIHELLHVRRVTRRG
jgi:hypothetical protein